MRKKLRRFRENARNDYLLQIGHPHYLRTRGCWYKHFASDQPITLEIGCGWGEYTMGLGQLFPTQHFVGMDVKGARLWKGASIARDKQQVNVRFLRAHAMSLPEHFMAGEVDRIWIPFPDPFGSGNKNRRLTAPYFMNIYRHILQKEGEVHLKTDDDSLFEDTLHTLNGLSFVSLHCATNDLYASPYLPLHYGVQTKYEKSFLALGKKIKYLSFFFVEPPQIPSADKCSSTALVAS